MHLVVSLLLLPHHWGLRDLREVPEEFVPCRGVQQCPGHSGDARGVCGCWYPSDTCKLCLFSFLILSSPNFSFACCTPGQCKEDPTSWFVIRVFLRIPWRHPFGLSSYHIIFGNHICLTPVCFPFCHEFVCLLPCSFLGLHVEREETIKGLEQLVYERTLKCV